MRDDVLKMWREGAKRRRENPEPEAAPRLGNGRLSHGRSEDEIETDQRRGTPHADRLDATPRG